MCMVVDYHGVLYAYPYFNKLLLDLILFHASLIAA